MRWAYSLVGVEKINKHTKKNYAQGFIYKFIQGCRPTERKIRTLLWAKCRGFKYSKIPLI
jgi:hypothetical protein